MSIKTPLVLAVYLYGVFSIFGRRGQTMQNSERPFEGITDVVVKNFELTKKAMENYIEFFQKNVKDVPWLENDLNKKMKGYADQNIAAATDFAQQLSKAKDVQDFWRIQAEFLQGQWKALSEQTKEFAEATGKAVTGKPKE